MATEKLRIVVLGYVVRAPLGGLTWHYLQYVIGLARLGHEVLYVEDSGDYVSCYDPGSDSMTTDPSVGLDYTEKVFSRVGLDRDWAYYDRHTEGWLGPARNAERFLEEADILLNVSGANRLRPWTMPVPVRVLLDTDPGFTQVKHLTDERRRRLAERHTHFLTFGEGIPAGWADIPDDGYPWRETRQPVVLDLWPQSRPVPGAPWSSLIHWEAYEPQTYRGRRFDLKGPSFALIEELPQHVDAELVLAVGGPAPRDHMEQLGWKLRDPLQPSRTPWTYQRFIAGSRAELGIAKHAYVDGRTGWFSERSAAYLASGRPVLVQETGFSEWLDVGEGVIPFSDLATAIEGVQRIDRAYDRHQVAARAVAREFFAADRVLPMLLDAVSTAPERTADRDG